MLHKLAVWRHNTPMAIRLLLSPSGEPTVAQVDDSPSVYLDHWALRKISSSAELADRLVAVIQERGGNLLISWLHLAEFTAVSDRSQVLAAESMLDRLIPNLFFVEINPFTVIEREDVLLAGGAPKPPHADLGFLDAFVQLRPTSPRPFTAEGLFSAIAQSKRHEALDALAATIVERLLSMRTEYNSSAGLRKAVLRLPGGPSIQRGTRLLLRELSRTFLLDSQLRITSNHAIDLLHAVVSSAYADYVLLDKHWETQVERARLRLRQAGLAIPVAQVFSGKGSRIPEFFAALAAK